jgi:hypothetical protein
MGWKCGGEPKVVGGVDKPSTLEKTPSDRGDSHTEKLV